MKVVPKPFPVDFIKIEFLISYSNKKLFYFPLSLTTIDPEVVSTFQNVVTQTDFRTSGDSIYELESLDLPFISNKLRFDLTFWSDIFENKIPFEST